MQDAKPIAVGQHFVFGIDGSHGIFQIQDGGQRSFGHQVRHTRWVCFANGMCFVNLQIEVQTVVLEEQGSGCFGITLEAHKLLGFSQGGGARFQAHHQLAVLHAVAGAVNVRAFFQGYATVKHIAAVFNHFGATLGVVARAFFAAIGFAQCVGAVQSVVQRTPTCIGGIECVSRIQNRHHQLRACQNGQFGINVFGIGFGALGFGNQVTNG